MLDEINKILRLPEKIPCDKRLHYIIGNIANILLLPFSLNVYLHIGLLIILAWGIEYYQKWTKSGQFDHKDAFAVLVGGLVSYIPMKLLGL